MSTRKLAIEYKDFVQFAKFTDSWAHELSKAEFLNIFDDDNIVSAIAEFVGKEIEDAVGGDPFGRFMAERTYVEIIPTGRGVTLNIGGYSEQEVMENGGVSRLSDQALEDMVDYNLWEMYEFHGGAIGTKGMPKGKGDKQVVKKDVAGPLVVRTSTGGTQQLRGRKGLINAVIPQIRSQLNIKLLDLLESMAGLVLTGAAKVAANEAKALKGLPSKVEQKVRKQAYEVDADLAKMGAAGMHVTYAKNGRILVKGGGGRFVSSPLHGKKMGIKRM